MGADTIIHVLDQHGCIHQAYKVVFQGHMAQ